MAQMTADQATFLLGIFVGTLSKESVATKNVIAAIPADKGDYKPDESFKVFSGTGAAHCSGGGAADFDSDRGEIRSERAFSRSGKCKNAG